MQEYLNKLRQKPKRVRERIAFGASLGFTGIVALGWVAVMIVSNPFSLEGNQVAGNEAESDISKAYEESRSSFSNLMGAAAAANSSGEDEAGIRIVDTKASTSASAPTVIPF